MSAIPKHSGSPYAWAFAVALIMGAGGCTMLEKAGLSAPVPDPAQQPPATTATDEPQITTRPPEPPPPARKTAAPVAPPPSKSVSAETPPAAAAGPHATAPANAAAPPEAAALEGDIEDGPAPALDPERLLGLDANGLHKQFGTPMLVETDGTAEVWEYAVGDCVLRLYLYADIGTGARRALRYDAAAAPGKDADCSPPLAGWPSDGSG